MGHCRRGDCLPHLQPKPQSWNMTVFPPQSLEKKRNQHKSSYVHILQNAALSNIPVLRASQSRIHEMCSFLKVHFVYRLPKPTRTHLFVVPKDETLYIILYRGPAKWWALVGPSTSPGFGVPVLANLFFQDAFLLCSEGAREKQEHGSP